MNKFNELSEEQFKEILINVYQLGRNDTGLNSESLIEEIKKQIMTAMEVKQ